MLKKLRELIDRAEGVGGAQEFGLSYSQLKIFLDDVKNIVSEEERRQPSVEQTKQELSDLLAMCAIEHTVCTSSGKPVSTYTEPLFEEENMYDTVADYLVNNGVRISPPEEKECVVTQEKQTNHNNDREER